MWLTRAHSFEKFLTSSSPRDLVEGKRFGMTKQIFPESLDLLTDKKKVLLLFGCFSLSYEGSIPEKPNNDVDLSSGESSPAILWVLMKS